MEEEEGKESAAAAALHAPRGRMNAAAAEEAHRTERPTEAAAVKPASARGGGP